MREIIISKNVPLTFRLRAHEIWISGDGEVTIVAEQYAPDQKPPKLTVAYLESLCCKFYFGGKNRQNSIADMLLLNGILSRGEYETFYAKLEYNLDHENLTVITLLLHR